MKILELRLKNLNSLYGEWVIDFTGPDYVAEGLFAITGPTGAGKTTILDAICLALYGATPRLGKLSASTNDVMSRHTGDCFAEVTFESQAGMFRCHWSQHRARKTAAGNLLDSKHEISDARTGQIIESKKRDVARVIEEKTGLDFDRFTRSMLLAQGGFAAFLQASPDERAPILEQLTGTEIYSDISKRVHERNRVERDKLEILQAETQGMSVLTPDQITVLTTDLEAKKRAEKELSDRLSLTVTALQWVIGIDILRQEMTTIAKELDTKFNAIQRSQPEREKLAFALKAAELDSDFAVLTSVRRLQQEDQVSLKTHNDRLPQLAGLLTQQETMVTRLAETVSNAKKIKTKESELITTVRELDVRYSESVKTYRLAESDFKKEALSLGEPDFKKSTDDGLPQDLGTVQVALRSHLGDRPLGEYRRDYDGICREMIYLKKIAGFEVERKSLRDGHSCPLCGSEDHPFARGNIPEMDDTEKRMNELSAFIKKAETLENRISQLEIQKKQAIITSLKIGCDSLRRERVALFGDKDPTLETNRLDQQIVDAETSEKRGRDECDHAKQQIDAVKVMIVVLNDALSKRNLELDGLEKSFTIRCGVAGFLDESLFVSHRLSLEARTALTQTLKDLEVQWADCTVRQKDRADRLAIELGKKLTDATLDELKQQSDSLTAEVKKISQELGAIHQQWVDDAAVKEKIKQKQVSIDAQKKECRRWETLHALIGSADGKKYRNFAQGITFELMVSHANHQLEKMTDRYLLIRDRKWPLELNVVDHYQAGDIRSAKNLSGGESFIVSLALALGLSKMASRKVRVDSLFLDEGFGTLDEDAQQMALDTLGELQQDGKLIGIISHIPAIKERISTQIEVRQISGGKSVLVGPGCGVG